MTVEEAIDKVLEGFDERVFVRNISKDYEPGWPLKAVLYAQDVEVLAADRDRRRKKVR